jgi:hypothetical protein
MFLEIGWKKRGLSIDRPFESWTFIKCPLLNSRTLTPKVVFAKKRVMSIMERNPFFLELFYSIIKNLFFNII